MCNCSHFSYNIRYLFSLQRHFLRIKRNQKITFICGGGYNSSKCYVTRPTYMDSFENEHAHSVLLRLPHYQKTTVNFKLLTPDCESSVKRESTKFPYNRTINTYFPEILDAYFYILNEYSDIDIKSHDSMELIEGTVIQKLSHSIQDISDKDLLKLLLISASVIELKPIFFNKFRYILKVIRKETITRMTHWNSDQILLVADIWYGMKFDLKFVYEAVELLGHRSATLSTPQIIQLFFYFNIIRTNKLMKSSESLINKILDDIGIEELGIIAMALFKTKTSLNSNGILQRIIQNTLSDIDSVSDISLCALVKLMQLNFVEFEQDRIELCLYVLKELQPHLRKLNSFCLVHIASLGNHYSIYDERVLQEIFYILFLDLSQLRLKDLERLTYVIMNSKMTPKNFSNYINLIKEELTDTGRCAEISLHTYSFLSCIYYLSCIDYNFSNFLLSAALKMNDYSDLSADHTKNIQKIQRDYHLMQLDRMISVEKPFGFKGYRLSSSYRDQLLKKYLPRIPHEAMKSLTKQEVNLLTVRNLMKKLNLRDEHMQLSCILPHFAFVGLIFCTTLIGIPTAIPSEFFSYMPQDEKYPAGSSDMLWNVILVTNPNSYLYNTSVLRGEFDVRIRQLQKMGYKVTVVSHGDLTLQNESSSLRNLCRAMKSSSLSLSVLKECS